MAGTMYHQTTQSRTWAVLDRPRQPNPRYTLCGNRHFSSRTSCPQRSLCSPSLSLTRLVDVPGKQTFARPWHCPYSPGREAEATPATPESTCKCGSTLTTLRRNCRSAKARSHLIHQATFNITSLVGTGSTQSTPHTSRCIAESTKFRYFLASNHRPCRYSWY